jgi:trigger factor
VRNDLLKKLAARVPFPVPGSLVDREIDRRVEDFAHRLMEQRIDPRKTNIDWAAFREGQREPANDAVASAIVLDEIVRRDDVRISEAEIDAELEKYAQNTGLTVPAIRARIEQEGGLGRLVAGMRREKALTNVMGEATIVEL